ncbi:MAG: ribosome maturation factor RimM [Bacteroidetes bacterium]|nr:ribosome maturation factor RimM [Bacteroidota bacterium]
MVLADTFYFGVLTKLKGFKGEIHFKAETFIEDAQDIKSVHLMIGKHLAEYKVERLSLHGEKGVVKFEGVNTEAEALSLLKFQMYLPSADFPDLEDDGNVMELLNYKVFDKEKGYLGEVSEINDQTAQTLITVKNNRIEILIPLVDEFIESIDTEKKEIHVDVPPALLSLND